MCKDTETEAHRPFEGGGSSGRTPSRPTKKIPESRATNATTPRTAVRSLVESSALAEPAAGATGRDDT